MSLSLHKQFLDPSSQKLADQVESTFDKKKRQEAILKLAKKGKEDECRSLMALFHYVVGKDTKATILEAMSKSQAKRGFYFLLSFVTTTQDFILGCGAIRALRYSKIQGTNDFLYSLIKKNRYEYFETILITLNYMSEPVDETTLKGLLKDKTINLRVRNLALLLLSRRGRKALEPFYPQKSKGDHLSKILQLVIGDKVSDRAVFIDQIEKLSCERDGLSKVFEIEDLVEILLEGESQEEKDLAIGVLLRREKKEVWKELSDFQGECDLNQVCLWRAFFFDEKRWVEDLDFIKSYYADLDISLLSIIIKELAECNPQLLSDKLHSFLPVNIFSSVCEKVHWEEASGELICLLESHLSDEKNVRQLLDAIIYQLLCLSKKNKFDHHVKRLLVLLKKAGSESSKSHIIRALGELQVSIDEFYIFLETIGILDSKLQSSSLYALERLGGERSCNLILSKLRDFQGSKDDLSKLYRVLVLVSQGQDISSKGLDVRKDSQVAPLEVLLLLSHHKIPGGESLILSNLEAGGYQSTMWALEAFSKNPFLAGWKIILQHLETRTPQIFGKAIEVVCKKGRKNHHKRLFEILSSESKDIKNWQTVFRYLTPERGKDYRIFIHKIEEVIEKGFLFEDEHMDYSQGVVERLSRSTEDYFLESGNKITSPSNFSSIKENQIRKLISDYDKLPKVVKGILIDSFILREKGSLFDTSTLVLQWAKAVDILLYTTLGQDIIVGGKDIYSRLQSDVLAYDFSRKGFDEEQFLVDFSCSEYFKTHEFPFTKLIDLCDGILSGRIFRDHLRIIDGPRSWGLLLLLFGRSITYKNRRFQPILSLGGVDSKEILKRAAQLNDLQEARNKGAHRTVYFEKRFINKVEKDTYQLINFILKSRP